jgi:hypothetical protein
VVYQVLVGSGRSEGKSVRRVYCDGEDFECQLNRVVYLESLHGCGIEVSTPDGDVLQDGESRIDGRRVVDHEGEVNCRVGVGGDVDVGQSTTSERRVGSSGVGRSRFDLVEEGTEVCEVGGQRGCAVGGRGDLTVGVNDSNLQDRGQFGRRVRDEGSDSHSIQS